MLLANFFYSANLFFTFAISCQVPFRIVILPYDIKKKSDIFIIINKDVERIILNLYIVRLNSLRTFIHSSSLVRGYVHHEFIAEISFHCKTAFKMVGATKFTLMRRLSDLISLKDNASCLSEEFCQTRKRALARATYLYAYKRAMKITITSRATRLCC